MCILFLSLDSHPAVDGFAVIIVNNRDELWDRPTKLADFWESDDNCISGLDETPGKEGGTWFGFSKTGKFASLLNILSSVNEDNKTGRGYLVRDFISLQDDGSSYVDHINETSGDYNGFNLVTLDIRSGFQFSLKFLSNWKKYYTKPVDIPPEGIHGFGNCRHTLSWKKVDAGKTTFARIVKRNGSLKKKNELTQELFTFLLDKTKHLPDESLEAQGEHLPEDLRFERAAINVWSPNYRYGTRTMTIVLIDSEGNADYIEKTLKTPVVLDNPEWITSEYRFKMNLRS